MLEEAALRKPDFVDGEPVVLADGQTWILPKPILFAKPTRFARKFQKAEGDVRKLGRPVALDGDPYFGKLQAMLEADGGEITLEAAFTMFLDLITHNYTITDEQAAELLPFIADGEVEQHEDNVELWTSVLDVCMGRSPKRSAATTES